MNMAAIAPTETFCANNIMGAIRADSKLTTLADGTILVSWTRITTDEDHKTFGKIFNSSGYAITEEFDVETSPYADTVWLMA